MSSQLASSYEKAGFRLLVFEVDPKPCNVAKTSYDYGTQSSSSISAAAVLKHERIRDIDGEVFVEEAKSKSGPVAEITAQVQHVFMQSTKSVAMKVLIIGRPISNFVKLFDRQEAAALRLEESIPAWTEKREIEYHKFILSGEVEKFFAFLSKDNGKSSSIHSDTSIEPWKVGHEEAYLQHRCQELFETELAAYKALKPLQGICVPRLLSHVVRQPFPDAPPAVQKFTNIPGLLLTYIKGFTLDQMAEHISRDRWQSICEDALRAVQAWGKLGVLNMNVRLSSCVVRRMRARRMRGRNDPEDGYVDTWDGSVYAFRPVIVGFDAVRLRKVGESDEQWEAARAEVDEVGVMGWASMKDFGPRRNLGGYRFIRRSVEEWAARGESFAKRPNDVLDIDIWDDEKEFRRLEDLKAYPQAYLVDEHDDLDSNLEELQLAEPAQGLNNVLPYGASKHLKAALLQYWNIWDFL